MHFQEKKVVYFERFKWQYVSIGSGNGLSPNKWQAITLANADPVHWHICGIRGEMSQTTLNWTTSLIQGSSGGPS